MSRLLAGRSVPIHLLALGVVVWLVALPFGSSAYTVGVVGRILAFGLFVASLDLLVGIAGLPSLGHGAFFGIGAYAAALLARDVTAVGPAQLAIAAAIGAAAAGVTGLVTIRSRGIYFVMLTLAIGELARQVADSWTSLTGGANGLAGVPALRLVPEGGAIVIAGHIYWYVLAVTALAYGLLAAVRASAFGQALKGMRDNEDRMRALGYSVTGSSWRRWSWPAASPVGRVAVGDAAPLRLPRRRRVHHFGDGPAVCGHRRAGQPVGVVRRRRRRHRRARRARHGHRRAGPAGAGPDVHRRGVPAAPAAWRGSSRRVAAAAEAGAGDGAAWRQ